MSGAYPAPVAVAGRPVGAGQPPYVIAELSANHLGRLERAIAILEAAHAAGADAFKLQTYTADTITLDHDGPGFTLEGGLWHGRRLHELYREAYMPWEWHAPLLARGRDLGIAVFSSPFDPTAIAALEAVDCPAYKIASFELVDLPLIARAAATGKPVIMSTGMASLGEIEDAVTAARRAGVAGLILLHCVSGYPTPADQCNLRTIPHLSQAFGVPVGLSDHTLGTAVAGAAVALGACVIEKHVTLARADGGPDAAFSLEPDELTTLVTSVREAWAACGEVSYATAASEAGLRAIRRSLYVTADMAAGQVFTEATVRSIRPGYGLPPKHLPEVLGRRARRAIARGTPLAWSLIDEGEGG
jgi:pseudaminic acid synthase